MSETQYVESRIADFLSESRRLSEVIKTKLLMIAELDSSIEQRRRAV